jgi:hypothetical protein
MNAAGRAVEATGVTLRARATVITSRPSRSKTAKRAGSAKFSAIESLVSAVANSIAP